MWQYLHLPGIEEVEVLLILELADNSHHHLVPENLRQKKASLLPVLQEHDKTAANFVKR